MPRSSDLLPPQGADTLLEVRDLNVEFHSHTGTVYAVQRVSFSLRPNETLGLVGESGCGKSTTAMALMGLLPQTAKVRAETVAFEGQDLSRLSQRELRQLRGDRISMVFQNPMTSLDPSYTVGSQIVDVLKEHRGMSAPEAREAAINLLRQVHIDSPERRFNTYPHHLSGGMRQRVVIAVALACNPDLLIADEPTTALDVTIQAQILSLLQDIRSQRRTAIILITHDLGVVAQMADRVAVMYAGRIVEEGPVVDVFENPLHPYTQALLRSIPSAGVERGALAAIEGTVPSLRSPARSCPFAPRCPNRMDRCVAFMPALVEVRPNHRVACFLHEDAHE